VLGKVRQPLLIVMVVLGGMGTLVGAVAGAAALIAVEEGLAHFSGRTERSGVTGRALRAGGQSARRCRRGRGAPAAPVVLGGMGTLVGAVAGAAALIAVEEGLAHFSEHWRM
jgi:ABC-type branched-subunit amino acid transport system permease subunit